MLAVTTAFKTKRTKDKQSPPDLLSVTSLGVWEVGLYLQPRSRGKGWPSSDKFKGEAQRALSSYQGQFPAQASFPLFDHQLGLK